MYSMLSGRIKRPGQIFNHSNGFEKHPKIQDILKPLAALAEKKTFRVGVPS